MKRQSKRFAPSKWSDRLVPLLLGLLLLGLLVTLAIVVLSILGLTPSSPWSLSFSWSLVTAPWRLVSGKWALAAD